MHRETFLVLDCFKAKEKLGVAWFPFYLRQYTPPQNNILANAVSLGIFKLYN